MNKYDDSFEDDNREENDIELSEELMLILRKAKEADRKNKFANFIRKERGKENG